MAGMPLLHTPVNHHLRPLYRTLAALAGLYVLVFGIVGIVRSSGLPAFEQDGLPWVLGLRANPAFAVLSIVAGAVLLLANLIGRNFDHLVNLAASVVFLLVGMAMLALLQTNANFLGFSMVNCIVSFILGLLTGIAGLYDKVGSTDDEAAEDAHRSAAASR
jgi:hypothetical protein